jgi:hypothetical protein
MTNMVLERRMRWAAIAVLLGLVVELISFSGHSPMAFILFVVIGGLSMAFGILLFLMTIVRKGGE